MNNARAPSGSLIACDSNDVVKTAKNQRKNRLLIQLPGLLSPLSAGAIGTLKNIDGETPSLSLDLPDGSSLELTGRRQTSSRAFMSLKMGDDVLGVKDVFETLIVFDCDQDLTDAQAGDASALKGPPDFEYGLSAVAAAGKSAKAPRRSGGVVCDSSGDEDDDDLDILETEPGSRRSSGRARKQVSYNVGHDDDDEEEEDDDDGGDFDLDDEVPLSPPPKPKRKRKDDEFDLDDEVPISPPKPKPKPRARKVSEPKPKAKPKKRASSDDDDVVELSSDDDKPPPKKRKSKADSDSDNDFEADSQSPVKPRSSSSRARKKVGSYAIDDDDEEEEPAAEEESDAPMEDDDDDFEFGE